MTAPDAREAVVELTLPSNPRYLSLVRVVAAAIATAVPSLSEGRVADLQLVVTELFTNAMEANWRSAGESAVSAPVRVACRADASGVRVTVTDAGPGLDASDEPHPPVGDRARLDHERGLGLPLIQYLADEVDYVSGSDGTTATVLLADRAPRRLDR